MKKLILSALILGSTTAFANCNMATQIDSLYDKAFLKNKSILDAKGFQLVQEEIPHEFTLKIKDALVEDKYGDIYSIGVTLEVTNSAQGERYSRIAHVNDYLEFPSYEKRKQRQVKKLLKKLPDCTELSKPGFDIQL